MTNCSTFDALIQSWNDIDLLSLFYSQCSFGPKEARRPSAKQAGKPLFKFSLTFSCSKFRETQGMRPTQQTDQNFIAWHNALYCIVHCKMYGMDILSMSLLPSTVFLSLLALKISLKNEPNSFLKKSSLPYSRVLDNSTFEFTTLPYPTLLKIEKTLLAGACSWTIYVVITC